MTIIYFFIVYGPFAGFIEPFAEPNRARAHPTRPRFFARSGRDYEAVFLVFFYYAYA